MSTAGRRARSVGPTIIGLSCSHDASACLVRDGELICAIGLERLTRVKHDGRPFLNQRLTADYCLNAFGLTAEDIDAFAFNIQNLIPQQVGLGFPLADESFDLFDPLGERSIFVSHHLAHAFAAFFCSPLDRAAVLVIDGSGGSVIGADDLLLSGPELAEYINVPLPIPRPAYHVESTYIFDHDGYRLVDRCVAASFHPMCGSSSLGETYAAVSQYVFGDWHEGGKLMGLAPYGDGSRLGGSFLRQDSTGRLQFSSSWKQQQCRANRHGDPMEYRDLAARVQSDLENAIVERASRAIRITGERDLAYAGGVALNSVANQRVLRESDVRNFYVMPASHDAGVSIGAASAAHFKLTGGTKGSAVTHDFHGRRYTQQEIASAVATWSGVVEMSAYDQGEVVDRLMSGQVIGWFESGSEFGPRSLGHRSIIAAPFERSMWEHLNRAIKYREEFRPYAPIVLEEAAGTFFDMGPDLRSRFMLRVVPVRETWRARLGAVTHADGSARVQTVDRRHLPRWHALLTAFGERTGVPVLVNTSMNVRGEPIVETPAQALETFLSTGMDALVLEDMVITLPKAVMSNEDTLVVTRGPTTDLTARMGVDGLEFRVASRARGGFFVEVPLSVFLLLAAADGTLPLNSLLTRYCEGPDQRVEAREIVRRLVLDRMLLATNGA